jgi:hypothetical protein
MTEILQRAWRAAQFDRNAFGDWLFSPSATGDAALLVIAVAAVQMLAAVVFGGGLGLSIVTIAIQVILSALAGWVFLAAATWFVGTRWFNGSGEMQAVLRLQGLAYLPNALAAAAYLTGFGAVLAIGGFLWYLAVAVVGTSIALSQPNRDAILSVVVGAAVLFMIQALFGAGFGAVGAAFGALT